MKTIAVWYLVTYMNGMYYSPPMPDLAECHRVQKDLELSYRSRCVRIEEVLK